MGIDLTTLIEKRVDKASNWEYIDKEKFFVENNLVPNYEFPFRTRNSRIFGFLGDINNCSDVGPLTPIRGLPSDASTPVLREFEDEEDDIVEDKVSYLMLSELIEHNYEQIIEDKETTETRIQTNPNQVIISPVKGTSGPKMTLRDFLGQHFFKELELLSTIGPPNNVRLVFWFHY